MPKNTRPKKTTPNPAAPKSLKSLDVEMERRAQSLTRLFEQRNKELSPFQTDPQVMALPHPLRAMATATTLPELFIAGVVGFEHEGFTRQALRNRLSNTSLWTSLEQRGAEQFMAFMQQSASGPGSLSGGSAGAMFQAMRYQQSETGKSAMFTIDEELVALLMLTDMDLDIPISEVRVPFDNVYIEFGKDRAAMPPELALLNPLSGRHTFEGAYISQTFDADGDGHLEVTMTGSPVGHTELGDDAIEWVSMRQAQGLTIEEALAQAFASSLSLLGATPEQVRAHEAAAPERFSLHAPAMSPRLKLILKALLYIGLKDVRTAVIGEREEAQKALARSQSGAHRRRALRHLLRSRQCILVMAPKAGLAQASGDTGSAELGEMNGLGRLAGVGMDDTGIAAHWRRGHFRRQRHGPEMSLTRIIWLAPQLINAQNLRELSRTEGLGEKGKITEQGLKTPAPKRYDVRA